jgi:hypothetical protein
MRAITWRDIVKIMCRGTLLHPALVRPEQLVERAKHLTSDFPRGLSLPQATWMLDHLDEPVRQKDVIYDD